MATCTVKTNTRFVLDSLANDSLEMKHILSVVIGTYEGKSQEVWNDLLDQIKEVNPFSSNYTYACTVGKVHKIVSRANINAQKWN